MKRLASGWPSVALAVGVSCLTVAAGSAQVPLPAQVEFYGATSYGYADADDARHAVDHVRGRPELLAGTVGEPRTALIFLHHYTVELFDPGTVEWVLIVHSSESGDPTRGEVSVLRLGARSLTVKGRARFPYRIREDVDAEDAARVIRERKQFDTARAVSSDRLDLVAGSYVYFADAGDFGGTAVVSRASGEIVFSASTVADGAGRLFVGSEPDQPEG